MDIIKSIYRWGRISENQIAVCYKDECVTYGELIKRINGISKRIIEKKRRRLYTDSNSGRTRG